MKKGAKLTPKQELFVSAYLKTGNATQAAIEAGYSEKTARSQGQRMLTKVDIASRVRAHQKKRNERLVLEEDFELNKAITLLKMCMEPKQVFAWENGEYVPVSDDSGHMVMQFDSKGANAALQTIAKIRGKFVNKVEVNATQGVSDMLTRLMKDER